MGILNVTPDSFSDGGRFADAAEAVAHAVRMCEEGAGIIDIGGESTRPGAAPVPPTEERRRVVPIVEGLLAKIPGAVVSVDTSKAEVARAALEAGAAIINDVTALRGDAEMARVVAHARAGLVLMHMQGTPATMQLSPHYDDVVAEVRGFLSERATVARTAGIDSGCLAYDPGIGFGKTLEHNLTLLRQMPAAMDGTRPTVIGVSRKAFLAKIAAAPTLAERLWPTVALTALLRQRGARIFRVHDVRENVAALRMTEALLGING